LRRQDFHLQVQQLVSLRSLQWVKPLSRGGILTRCECVEYRSLGRMWGRCRSTDGGAHAAHLGRGSL